MATGRGCGCSQGCGCAVVEDDEGLFYWTGNGSPGSPFRVGMASSGFGCQAVVGCVSQALDPGLAFNPVTDKLNVELSKDAGNTITIAADGGLMGTGGLVTPCAHTIAALPTFAFGGDKGGSGMIKAFSCQQGPDWAAMQGLDFVEVDVQAGADQVASPIRFMDENNLYEPTDLNASPDWTIRDLRTAEWSGARVAHSTPTNPDPFDTNTGWPKPAGWYGYLEAEEFQWSLSAWLKKARERFVTIVNVLTSVNPAFHVDAAIKSVQRQCAQQSTFIQVEWLDRVPQIVAAGITPMVRVTGSGTSPSVTAAAVTAAGAQWARLDMDLADSVFQTFRDAGIKVIAYTGSRQWQTTRFQTLAGGAIRGVLCGDPVYARGVTPLGRSRYWRPESKFELRRRHQGMCDSFTDRRAYFANGYFTANYSEDVLHRNRNSTDSGIHDGVLPGFCMPIDPTWMPLPVEGYTLEVYGRTESTPATLSALGWYVCAADDRYLGHSAANNAPIPFYAVTYRPVSGVARIEKIVPGASPVVLASGTAGSTSADGAWTLLRVSVTAAQIKFTCVPQNGTASAVITSTDTAYRGLYATLAHHQEGAQYDIGWRDLATYEGAI